MVQSAILETGFNYLLETEITDYTSGELQVYDGIGNTPVGSEVGITKVPFLATLSTLNLNSGNEILNNPFVGSIDNVKVNRYI